MAVGVAAEVKNKLTVLDVVGETVQLKRAGTTWKGLCPFHGEKTPSFVVTPNRETWHCFGCSEGGDIFSFVMRRDGVSFPDALRTLAARAGVEIDERTSREDARRKRLSEAMEAAFAFYHVVLRDSPRGATALAYLRSRGFTDETIDRFQLGYAPEAWDSMVRALARRRQIAAPDLIEVGLAQPRRSGQGAYDRFRGRVLFPIRDATGNATGLGGRILPEGFVAPEPAAAETGAVEAVEAEFAADTAEAADTADGADAEIAAEIAAAAAFDEASASISPTGDAADGIANRDSEPRAVLGATYIAPGGAAGNAALADHARERDHGPKYLNSPATPLFDKSRTLYPLDRARNAIRKSGIAVIVEGYTDALMAHQAGFENVVASLGTALTPGQVALLTRYAAHKIVLAYDVDPAGERAGTLGVQALEQLTRQLADTESGVELDEVRVARLPDGKDPDEVIRANPDLWREAIRTASPIVEYLIDHHAKGFDLHTTGGRARFVDAILPTLRPIKNPVLLDGYLQRLRQVSGVEERILLQALRRAELGAQLAGGENQPGREIAHSRISAEAVLASPDAFDPRAILGAIDPVEAALLQFLLSVPETQEGAAERLLPEHLPSQPARELWKAILAVHADPPYTTERVFTSLEDDPETQALMVALMERRDLPAGGATTDLRLAEHGIEQCLLRLELDRLEERARWTRIELGEAERAKDTETIARLMAQENQYNDMRRSLHRRVEQASLLNRPGLARGAGTPGRTAAPTGGTA